MTRNRLVVIGALAAAGLLAGLLLVFLGGSSNPEKVVNALRIITSDPNVKVILFNIFGGITRTDDVANGIVAATRQFKVELPIVIRLTGTNEAAAFRILHGVGMRALSDMDEAVKQAVALA